MTPLVPKWLRFIPVYVLRYPEEVWELLSSIGIKVAIVTAEVPFV